MKIFGAIAILAIIFLSSCDKGTDASDLASTYAGSYVITDTTTYLGPNNQTVTQYNSGATCSMTETSFTTLSLNQFPRLGCPAATAVVAATTLSLANVDCGAGPVNFVCTLSGTTLYFHYDYHAGTTLHISGIAVRQ